MPNPMEEPPMTPQLPQVTRIYQFHSLDSSRWNQYQPR